MQRDKQEWSKQHLLGELFQTTTLNLAFLTCIAFNSTELQHVHMVLKCRLSRLLIKLTRGFQCPQDGLLWVPSQALLT